jgi:hypothetical protein
MFTEMERVVRQTTMIILIHRLIHETKLNSSESIQLFF